MRRFVSLTVLVGVLLASCVDQSAVEPVARPQFSTIAYKFDKLAQYQVSPSQFISGLAWRIIGPAGGSLSLAGFEVVVPPGAVSFPTLFTIHLPLDLNSAEFVRAQFGPHRQFNVPVTIRLPLEGTTADETSARVLWWNGYDWEPFPTTLTGDGRIETKTSHFSEYGTEAPLQKGIILVGGGK
jgi:hypothetical protein